MWRLSATLRLTGLVLYALGLAVFWTLWGALVLVGALGIVSLRLVGVSLVRLERTVDVHQFSWRSAVRILPRDPTGRLRAGLAPAPHRGDTGKSRPAKEVADVQAPRESRTGSPGSTALRGGRSDDR